jgi:hypothetical protein
MRIIYIICIVLLSCQSKPSKAEKEHADRQFSALIARNVIEAYFQENRRVPNSFDELLDKSKYNYRIPDGFNNSWKIIQHEDKILLKLVPIAEEITNHEKLNKYKLFIYYSGDGKFDISHSEEMDK